MNVFLQHKFEIAKNNFNYCFCVPAGSSYQDAKEVLDGFKAHLDAMEAEQNKKQEEKEAAQAEQLEEKKEEAEPQAE